MSRTLLQIRQSILRMMGGVVGTATAGGDNASLKDTYGLQGGDDELNGRMIYMTKTGGATATDKTYISDYDSSTHDATLSPVVSGVVTSGDTYEMYPSGWNVDDVNDVINRAIDSITSNCPQHKVTTGNFTLSDIYEYSWLSNFVALHLVEYVSSIGTQVTVSSCDTAWTAGTNTTVTLDNTIQVEGAGCAKIVVAGGAGATEVLAYQTFSSVDLSDCDKIEFSIYSTVALTASYWQIRLDDTAGGGSAVESLNIPAVSANTWTTCQVSLANPLSDTAIVRIELYQVTDVGACTAYLDNIRCVKNASKVWTELNPEYWKIVRGTTPYLKLTEGSFDDNTEFRLSGYMNPSRLTSDSQSCEIDSEYITEWALSYLFLYSSGARQFDVENRNELGKIHLLAAEKRIVPASTNLAPNTIFI